MAEAGNGTTAELIEALAAAAARPLGEGITMPPRIYNDPAIHALELERIFARDWLCPGPAAEIPEPGDYLTFSIGTEPIVVMRQQDGSIRAFSNVCRHRMMILLEGRGKARRIVCPYHAWTYDAGGRLIGAGHMQRTEGFDKSQHCLPQFRTEIWNGWIYVTADPEARPVAELLAGLEPVVARYRMADYIPVTLQDHVWQTNWKLLDENFMEGYHLPVAHKATVGAWFPVEDTEFSEEVFEAFTYQTFTKDENATYGRAHKDNTRLEGRWRHTSILPTIYPTHMYVLAPDHYWYLSLRPKGPGETLVRFGIALAPEVHASLESLDDFLAPLLSFFDKVNAEDRMVVEGIYRGSLAPTATAGPLSWLEREIHDFIGYVARRLTSGEAVGGKAGASPRRAAPARAAGKGRKRKAEAAE
ncbi:MAG: Rieske 2Fe-2S domain-containing protein [Hyphomicrobiaceae bacterium]